jgi:hypothetical protein
MAMQTTQTQEWVMAGALEDTPQLYADGTIAALFGPQVCKIVFQQVVGISEDGKEIRKPVLHLVMATATWLEVCRNGLDSVTGNKDAMFAAIDDMKKKMFPE